MPEDNSHSLVPKPSGELSASSGAERILSEMTSDALKIHQGGLTKSLEPGTLIWEFEAEGDVSSSPAIGSDGTVYVGSDDKKLYALNGANGAKKWEFQTGGWVRSSPAIGSDGIIYVGSNDKKLYAIYTDSQGPAQSPWPMLGQNALHTGRVKPLLDRPPVLGT